MSLATRCTSCGTVFKVVQDQLKVSEGWVRCGRCDEIFNALEGLFDLDRDAPPDWSPLTEHAAAEVATDAESLKSAEQRAAVRSTALPSEPTAVARSATAAVVSDVAAPNAADAVTQARASDAVALANDAMADDGYSTLQAEASVPAAPDFLSRSRRQSWWKSTAARVAMSGAGAVLLVALAAQVAFHFRGLVAARLPSVRPALIEWCDVLGCTIDPLRRIEDITVESTALTRVGGSESFRLGVVLRNRGATMLALPSLELSLTDSGGQLVARRTLNPPEFPSASPIMMPGTESALHVMLTTGSSRVTGYTVEIFYP